MESINSIIKALKTDSKHRILKRLQHEMHLHKYSIYLRVLYIRVALLADQLSEAIYIAEDTSMLFYEGDLEERYNQLHMQLTQDPFNNDIFFSICQNCIIRNDFFHLQRDAIYAYKHTSHTHVLRPLIYSLLMQGLAKSGKSRSQVLELAECFIMKDDELDKVPNESGAEMYEYLRESRSAVILYFSIFWAQKKYTRCQELLQKYHKFLYVGNEKLAYECMIRFAIQDTQNLNVTLPQLLTESTLESAARICCEVAVNITDVNAFLDILNKCTFTESKKVQLQLQFLGAKKRFLKFNQQSKENQNEAMEISLQHFQSLIKYINLSMDRPCLFSDVRNHIVELSDDHMRELIVHLQLWKDNCFDHTTEKEYSINDIRCLLNQQTLLLAVGELHNLNVNKLELHVEQLILCYSHFKKTKNFTESHLSEIWVLIIVELLLHIDRLLNDSTIVHENSNNQLADTQRRGNRKHFFASICLIEQAIEDCAVRPILRYVLTCLLAAVGLIDCTMRKFEDMQIPGMSGVKMGLLEAVGHNILPSIATFSIGRSYYDICNQVKCFHYSTKDDLSSSLYKCLTNGCYWKLDDIKKQLQEYKNSNLKRFSETGALFFELFTLPDIGSIKAYIKNVIGFEKWLNCNQKVQSSEIECEVSAQLQDNEAVLRELFLPYLCEKEKNLLQQGCESILPTITPALTIPPNQPLDIMYPSESLFCHNTKVYGELQKYFFSNKLNLVRSERHLRCLWECSVAIVTVDLASLKERLQHLQKLNIVAGDVEIIDVSIPWDSITQRDMTTPCYGNLFFTKHCVELAILALQNGDHYTVEMEKLINTMYNSLKGSIRRLQDDLETVANSFCKSTQSNSDSITGMLFSISTIAAQTQHFMFYRLLVFALCCNLIFSQNQTSSKKTSKKKPSNTCTAAARGICNQLQPMLGKLAKMLESSLQKISTFSADLQSEALEDPKNEKTSLNCTQNRTTKEISIQAFGIDFGILLEKMVPHYQKFKHDAQQSHKSLLLSISTDLRRIIGWLKISCTT